jgi:hypothetical protein
VLTPGWPNSTKQKSAETVYLDIMESPFHYQVQAGLRDYLKDCLAKLLVATDDTEIRQLIRSVKEQGTASINYEKKLYKQADVSFDQAGTLPSLASGVGGRRRDPRGDFTRPSRRRPRPRGGGLALAAAASPPLRDPCQKVAG